MAKIDGVTDIVTDIENRACTFKVTKQDVDYEAKLAEFAMTNEHLKDYKIQ